MENNEELERIKILCEAIGLPLISALKELESLLLERRDLISIPHPDWRRNHIDATLVRLIKIYGSDGIARERLEAIKRLAARDGVRVEDKDAQKSWKDNEFLLQKGIQCVYCRTPLYVTSSSVDHRIPLARGGDDQPSNWQLTCYICNQGKSDLIEDRAIGYWRSAGLYRQLTIEGKTSINPSERFFLLSRTMFQCDICKNKTDKPVQSLALCYRNAPKNGGQAVPENCIVLCTEHKENYEEIDVTGGIS